MDRSNIEVKLKEIIQTVKVHDNLSFCENLFDRHNNLESRDMVVIMMEIKKTFEIDLNQLVGSLSDYTVNNITSGIEHCLREKVNKPHK